MNFSSTASFIWSVADLLRGDYKQSDYGKVILPFTLLRRLECVLQDTREEVLNEYEAKKKLGIPLDAILKQKSKQSFYNTSEFTLEKLANAADQSRADFEHYLDLFSENTRDIFERFKFKEQLDFLEDNNLLYLLIKKFAQIDLHPESISNHDMGLIFEELIRRFAEDSNETAGEHFTPRDIIRLTTALVFLNDDELLRQSALVRSLYDPTAGTGGFLSSGSEYVFL